MKNLRQYIRQILQEVYQMSREEQMQAIDVETDNYYGAPSIKRALGIQWPEEIEKERDLMRKYQQELRTSDEGKRFIRAFMNGTDVTIFHSITYLGYATGVGYKTDRLDREENTYSNWIKKYGKKGKDSLSVVAVNTPLGKSFNMGDENTSAVKSFGFIMKGYPVLACEIDMMTQTLGALPPDLVDHQKNSGIAKRGDPIESSMIKNLDFQWAGEVILDNWQIIGAFFNLEWGGLNSGFFEKYVQDAMSLGLPLYIYDYSVCLGKITDEESYTKMLKEISR